MEARASSGQEVLQLHAVLRSISPLIWRRLLVRSDTSVASLHQILQVAFGWQDMHLHRFEIRGREYGVHQEGGVFFDTDAHEVLIGQLKLRRLKRFTYEYDFGDLWVHDLRIEATLPVDPKLVYPVCIAGRRAAPPEDCGGPQAFMATRFEYALIGESRSRHELEDLLDAGVEGEEWAILRHYHPDRFDRRAVNRRLAALATPSQERWAPMRVTVQIRIEGAAARPVTVPLHTVDRACDQVQDVGLVLGDAKSILGKLQQTLVRQQLESYLAERRACPHCQRPRAIKGYHPLRFRTAFGDIDLRSPRWRRCRCEQSRDATFCPLSELLTVHTSPELAYLEAKWAAQVSFASVRALLQEVLPIEHGLHEETIRQHVLAIAERLEAQLGPEQLAYDGGSQREIEASPEPAAPITVGLDGGYVRGRERLPGANGCFEVIAGKSMPEEGAAKVFAFVHRIDRKPKWRLRAVLESQGILPRQRITFLCDGGDTVRELGAFVHPRSEHILDWFHVAMRIEQLLQTTRGLQGAEKPELLKGVERVKWFLWHGNVTRADETLYELLEEIDGVRKQGRQAGRPPSVELRKLDRALDEFATYVDNNAGAIVNYGERYRCGERIATGFVESAVNQVIAKRFVKRQQMRWTPRGAHLLLQVRTQMLNDELRASFERWYPGFGAQDQAPLAA